MKRGKSGVIINRIITTLLERLAKGDDGNSISEK